MAETVADRLKADFCPPLDSSLLSALLLDFPDEPSAEDEAALRTTLSALAADVDTEERAGHESQRESRDTASVEGATPAPAGRRRRAFDGRLHDDGNSAATSELGSALEIWSLDDPAGERPASRGEQFWDGSRVSTTSDESADGRDLSAYAPPSDAPDDPLAFLASVFPEVDLGVLEKRLAEADGDMEHLVDDMLSEGFIDGMDDETPAAPVVDKTAAAADKIARRKAKQALKASTKLSLTSPALHHIPSPLAAVQDRDHAPSAISLAPTSTNRWASISSHAEHLSSLMHVSAARITSTYHACSSSLPLTVSTLLHRLAHERPFAELESAHDLKMQLGAILPKISGPTLEVLLSATEGDLADAMDLQHAIDEIERTDGKLTWSELIELEAASDPAIVLVRDSRRTTGTNGTSTPDSAISSGSFMGNDEVYSYRDCVVHEQDYARRRESAIRSAMRHYKRGGNAQRGAAYYWAEEGRILDGKRRIWSERAAKALVRERRLNNKNTIDLHGLTHAHALTVVHEACTTWWASSSSISPHPLRIITGLGRHSANQQAILAPAVAKLLDREGWKWRWDGVGGTGGSGENAKGALLVLGVKR